MSEAVEKYQKQDYSMPKIERIGKKQKEFLRKMNKAIKDNLDKQNAHRNPNRS